MWEKRWHALCSGEREKAWKNDLAGLKFPLKWENTKKILEKWSWIQNTDQSQTGTQTQDNDWLQNTDETPTVRHSATRKILLCGSPVLLYSPYLNRNLEAAIEKRNIRPVYASLTEYIWFWLKEAGREVTDFFTETLTEFAGLFPDSCIGGTYEAQYTALQARFPQVTGGNLRYLAWRCEDPGSDINGIIRLLPAYANYSSIIRLLEETSPVPLLHYQLDGNEEQDEIEKREIFLNLLERGV